MDFKKRVSHMDRKKLRLVAAIFALSVLIAVAAAVVITNVREVATLPADDYEIFFVEGMPCVRVYRIDGISCDWSKWAGR
jgi:type IV secretory pathway component VirB8